MGNYQNKNLGDLQGKQTGRSGSRRVFFVPRLLTKMAKKLVFNLTGKTHESLKEYAIQTAMDIQAGQAAALQPRINAGNKALETYSNDEKTYSESKTYAFMIKDLVEKQHKLKTKPRKLLVAASYVILMKNYHQKKVARDKEIRKQKIIAEYNRLIAEQTVIKGEITGLEAQIAPLSAKKEEAYGRLDQTNDKIEALRNAHPIIIDSYLSANTQGTVSTQAAEELEPTKTM